MNEDILSRARMLAQAANQVADQMSLQVDEYKAVIQARRAEEAITAAMEVEKRINTEKARSINYNDVGSQKMVRGAAICGSSLVTTYEDVRPFAPRGSIILIDGVRCKLREQGEWTANRIELETDFTGSTNLDAEIGAIITAEIVKKRSPKRNKALPVASGEISSAVANLNVGPILSTREPITNRSPKKQKQKKSNVSLNSSSIVADSLSDYSRALLSAQDLESRRTEYHQPDVSLNIYEPKDSSRSQRDQEFSSKPPLGTSHPLTLSHTTRSHSSSLSRTGYGHPSSPSSRSILSTNSNHSISKSSVNSMGSSIFPSSQTVMTGHEIISTDHQLEPEQIQMLTEIDDITPEEQQRRRFQMNIRMVDRGQQKAVERVAHRRREEEEEKSLQSHQPLQYEEHLSDDVLAERRKLAYQRVLTKRQEEERALAEKIRKEEEEREEYKKKMKEKEEKLKEITQQRVAEYKLMKKEKERKKREEKEAEILLKKEREMECQSEVHLRRLQQRMAETEARLQKQKKDLDEKKYLDQIEIENKLSEIASQRQRTKNIFSIPPPASVPPQSDDQSKGSSQNGKKEKGSALPKIRNKQKKGEGDSITAEPEDENIKVSINTKPAHFLPGIRTSTSEQSNRKKSILKNTPSDPTGIPPRPRVDRHKSADSLSHHHSSTPATTVSNPPPSQRQVESDGRREKGRVIPERDELDDLNEEDYMSDDSLTQLKNNHSKQKKSIAISKNQNLKNPSSRNIYDLEENGTVISALTNDTHLQSFVTESEANEEEKKKKKKKRKVWKMEPIPVRPYVQVPANEL